MEKMNVSNSNADEMRRPTSNAYCEDAGAEDSDTLSELSENELLFGFLNPNLLPNTSALAAGQVSGQAPSSSVGD